MRSTCISLAIGLLGLAACLPDRDLVKPSESGQPENPVEPGKINLRINEVVSTGSPDWFEIVNLDEAAIQLKPGEWYFTDDFKNPTKYRLGTEFSLSPGAYHAVECSNGGLDADNSQLRANTFSFSSQGEQIAVIKIVGSDATWVDSVTFPAISSGSYGRSPNGTGAWRLLSKDSKGKPNP